MASKGMKIPEGRVLGAEQYVEFMASPQLSNTLPCKRPSLPIEKNPLSYDIFKNSFTIVPDLSSKILGELSQFWC